jgi:hypothetical protein
VWLRAGSQPLGVSPDVESGGNLCSAVSLALGCGEEVTGPSLFEYNKDVDIIL